MENFVLSINYCQPNTLSTFSILYHLVKTFMAHTRSSDLFSIVELIVSNILSCQILRSELSQLAPEIQNLESIAVFKNKLLSFIRPRKRFVFNANDPEGVKYLTRLRLRFSHLNEHKFRHGFLDTLNPLCNCSLEVEDSEHFFLRCLNFENARRSLFIDKSSIDSTFKDLGSHLKVELLLFGDFKLSAIDNNLILKAFIKYIMTTNIFSDYFPSLFPLRRPRLSRSFSLFYLRD